MKLKSLILFLVLSLFFLTIYQSLVSYPHWNDDDNEIAGCANSCHERHPHNHYPDMIEATVLPDNKVSVKILGIDDNSVVGGELVTLEGEVIHVINHTPKNPFILNAPAPGIYMIYAGGWDKVKKLYYDTLTVEIVEMETSTLHILNFSADRVCVEDRFDIEYEVDGMYDDDNIFRVRLSNINGDFGGETDIIGIKHSSESGFIPCKISHYVKAGDDYKIRIEASLPDILSENTVPIVISGKPYAKIGFIRGDFSFCENETVEMRAVSDNPHLDFLWSNGESTQSIIVNEPGRYILTVTNIAGCFAEDTIYLESLPTPTPVLTGVELISEQILVKYSVDFVQGDYYYWDVDKGEIVGINENYNEITVAWNELGQGMVCVTEETQFRCDSTVCLEVDVTVGVDTKLKNPDISIKYISSSNQIIIKNQIATDITNVYIYNVLGELVYTRNATQSVEIIDVEFLNTGLYMVQVIGDQKIFTKSILIE